MAKMHSYSVDNQPFRLTVLSWIALATFVTVVLADSLKESSFDFSSLKTSLLSAGSSAGLVTITFLIIYWVYAQFLWKINPFDKVPNLSGTWIGMGSNPYFEPLRLELMKIKQHWAEISIAVKVYEGNNVNPTEASSWLKAIGTPKAVLMGTEDSTIALITESDLIFNYDHRGMADGQGSFKGVMFLKYEKTENFHELEGNYINAKKGKSSNKQSQSEENFEGVVGRVVFRRVSSELIETKEALQKIKDKDILVYLHGQVTAQIQGSSKA
jgi:hypothetical protein